MRTRHVTIIITESIEIAHGEFFKAKTFALLNDFIFVASSMAIILSISPDGNTGKRGFRVSAFFICF
jgi:hypothetical protein